MTGEIEYLDPEEIISTFIPCDGAVDMVSEWEHMLEYKFSHLTPEFEQSLLERGIVHPVAVSFISGRYWLHDGHHRVVAAWALGIKVPVIWQVTYNSPLPSSAGLPMSSFTLNEFLQQQAVEV